MTSFGPEGQLLYHLRAYPPDEGSGWKWASSDQAVVDPAAARRVRSEAARTPGRADDGGLVGLRLTAQQADTTAPRKPAGAPGSLADVDPDKECGGNFWYWTRYDGAIIRKHTRVQYAKTKDRTKVSYVWGHTRETQVDAAANLGANGALVRAGLVRVARKKAEATMRVGHNKHKDFTVEFDFRSWILTCVVQPGGKEYSPGVYEWRPFKFTGGHEPRKAKTGFDCNLKWAVNIKGSLKVSEDTSYTYSTGVSYAGVGLRSRQTNSDNHVISYTASKKRAGLCGARAYPAEARRVKEILPQ